MTAQQNIRSIATRYRGFQFRSRLEAKWAAFFDLCGWKWSYEPKDFNGWIPDFALGERPTLVEVKPFYREDEWADVVKQIKLSGCKEPVILLGADPTFSDEWSPWSDSEAAPHVAWLLDYQGDVDAFGIWDLHFGFTEGKCYALGLCPMCGGWVNCIWNAPPEGPECSHPNKWARVYLGKTEKEGQLVARWAEACNISQWVPLCK